MLEITSELVKLLVCPVSRGKLTFDQTTNELISLDSGLAYPVRDGIPLILAEYGRKLTEEELIKYNKLRLAEVS